MKNAPSASPFDLKNIRYFIAFRVFFNSRFYYPVFTILFLDFGLTIEQFALLNVAWAATIVVLEVPSGAMADVIGRRRLLVLTGTIMVFEIALLCFAPQGNITLLFYIFLINRILSGTAEAAASGADEALAYDTLKEQGDEKDWGRVLEKQMRMQSLTRIIAMSMGAAVYDPDLLNRIAAWLGFDIRFSQSVTLRFPLFLTLAMAIMALFTTLKMKEVEGTTVSSDETVGAPKSSIAQAFRTTLQAGAWIIRTPFALMLIAGGVMFDHVIRMLGTLNSQYYRLIDLPEASFGLIGSGLAVLGLFIPRIALRFADEHSPLFNFLLMSAATLVGLIGITFMIPIYGVFLIALLFCVIHLNSFFISHYLNRIADSKQRATVLSFKGLSMNLAYGIIGVLYSFLIAAKRSAVFQKEPDVTGQILERLVFIKALSWFPGYFLLMFLLLVALGVWILRRSSEHRRIG